MKKLSSRMKFKDFIEYYNENIAKLRWSITTRTKAKSIIEKRIIPELGDIKLCNLNEEIIRKFLLSLITSQTIFESQSNHSIKKSYYKRVRSILSSIISCQVELHLIKENYLHNVRVNIDNFLGNVTQELCKCESARIKTYDKETYQKVLNLLKGVPIEKRAIIEIALKTGLRKSEIFGLKWEDIDFENRTITVNKSRQYIKGTGMVLKSTKNIASNRKIAISDSLVNLLQYFHQNSFNSYDCFLFENTSFLGVSEWFRRWQKQNGINPVIRFHDLRHTHASLLLMQGVDFKTISSRLGHSRIVTTMNIYAHVIESLDQSAALKIEELEYNYSVT